MIDTDTKDKLSEKERQQKELFSRGVQNMRKIAELVFHPAEGDPEDVDIPVNPQSIPTGMLSDALKIGVSIYPNRSVCVYAEWWGNGNDWLVGVDYDDECISASYAGAEIRKTSAEDFAKLSGPKAELISNIFYGVSDLRYYIEQGIAEIEPRSVEESKNDE